MSSSSISALVVDDDIAVCRILHRMLSDEQYQVQISQSVTDALETIDKRPFDVYVMDYKLPDGTGLDVAERIRSKGSAAPIILISGYDSSAVGVRAAKLQISDIIEKPFSRLTICNAVKKAIGFSAAAEQHAAVAETPKPVATKKRFSNAAFVGALILLLLLVCVTIYLTTHVH